MSMKEAIELAAHLEAQTLFNKGLTKVLETMKAGVDELFIAIEEDRLAIEDLNERLVAIERATNSSREN